MAMDLQCILQKEYTFNNNAILLVGAFITWWQLNVDISIFKDPTT